MLNGYRQVHWRQMFSFIFKTCQRHRQSIASCRCYCCNRRLHQRSVHNLTICSDLFDLIYALKWFFACSVRQSENHRRLVNANVMHKFVSKGHYLDATYVSYRRQKFYSCYLRYSRIAIAAAANVVSKNTIFEYD